MQYQATGRRPGSSLLIRALSSWWAGQRRRQRSASAWEYVTEVHSARSTPLGRGANDRVGFRSASRCRRRGHLVVGAKCKHGPYRRRCACRSCNNGVKAPILSQICHGAAESSWYRSGAAGTAKRRNPDNISDFVTARGLAGTAEEGFDSRWRYHLTRFIFGPFSSLLCFLLRLDLAATTSGVPTALASAPPRTNSIPARRAPPAASHVRAHSRSAVTLMVLWPRLALMVFQSTPA